MPLQHLPGRRLHAGRKLRAKFTARPRRSSTCSPSSPRRCARSSPRSASARCDEVIGRTDLLTQVSRGAEHLDDLDLNPLLVQADPGERPRYCTLEGRNEVPDTLDAQMIARRRALLERGEKMQLTYNVRNTHRAIGTRAVVA